MELQQPKGVRDFPPEEKIMRDKVVNALIKTFESYGFNPLETPILELWEVLTSKYGASQETDVMQEVYKLTDRGARDLGLRYELTLSTARFVGMNPQLKLPFKRYQIGSVFRDGPIKLGRYREFTQCDVDTFGCKRMTADAEILLLAIDAFEALGIQATLQVNNRKLLNGLLQAAGVPADKTESAIITIDKFDKQGADEVRKELEQKGISDDAIAKALGFFQAAGTNKEKLEQIEQFLPAGNGQGREGITELKELFSYLASVPEGRILFNPSLARGLAYYTGTVFEGFFEEGEVRSSICGGGRYDKMVGELLGSEKEMPAVGIAFGLEPITEQLKLLAKAKPGGMPKTVVKVLVVPIRCFEAAVGIAQRLRKAGIRTDIDLLGRGISKNLEAANQLDIPYSLIVGRQELEQGKVKLKDMRTGTEELLPLEEVEQRLA